MSSDGPPPGIEPASLEANLRLRVPECRKVSDEEQLGNEPKRRRTGGRAAGVLKLYYPMVAGPDNLDRVNSSYVRGKDGLLVLAPLIPES